MKVRLWWNEQKRSSSSYGRITNSNGLLADIAIYRWNGTQFFGSVNEKGVIQTRIFAYKFVTEPMHAAYAGNVIRSRKNVYYLSQPLVLSGIWKVANNNVNPMRQKSLPVVVNFVFFRVQCLASLVAWPQFHTIISRAKRIYINFTASKVIGYVLHKLCHDTVCR